MKEINQMVNYMEGITKQLEGLAYSKKRDLSLKLLGHFEATLYLAEVPNSWEHRFSDAMVRVMQDPPELEQVKEGVGGLTPVQVAAPLPAGAVASPRV